MVSVYHSKLSRLRHPDRISAFAYIRGVKTTEPKKSKILELGCSSGDALISLSLEYPNSSFVGIDSDNQAIDKANKLKSKFNLTNVDFICASIDDYKSTERFDYIFAHGVYSWVSETTREILLNIANKTLTDNGLLYLSFNPNPAWQFRGIAKNAFSRVSDTNNPKDIKEGLRKLHSCFEFDLERPFSIMLSREIERITKEPDSYLEHEFLGEHNKAFYLSEVVKSANINSLQYLGDARLERMSMNRLLQAKTPSDAFRLLMQLSNGDQVKLEELCDFLFYTPFRESIFCREECRLSDDISIDKLKKLSFSLYARFDEEDSRWIDVKGLEISSPNSIAQESIKILSDQWPRYMHFEALFLLAKNNMQEESIPSIGDDDHKIILLGSLLEWLQCGILEFGLNPRTLPDCPPKNPKTSQLINEFALQEKIELPNLLHNTVEIGEFDREMLLLCNGSTTRDEFINHALSMISYGKGEIREDGVPITDPDIIKEFAERLVESSLNTLTKAGLLYE